jgi:hypothetical protein
MEIILAVIGAISLVLTAYCLYAGEMEWREMDKLSKKYGKRHSK